VGGPVCGRRGEAASSPACRCAGLGRLRAGAPDPRRQDGLLRPVPRGRPGRPHCRSSPPSRGGDRPTAPSRRPQAGPVSMADAWLVRPIRDRGHASAGGRRPGPTPPRGARRRWQRTGCRPASCAGGRRPGLPARHGLPADPGNLGVSTTAALARRTGTSRAGPTLPHASGSTDSR
jgi:hypothetical protein